MIHTESNDCLAYTEAKYIVKLGNIGKISAFFTIIDAKNFVLHNFKVEECYSSEDKICYIGKDITLEITKIS